MNYRVIDNFFEDIDSVRNYALSQKYEKLIGTYPGLRNEVADEKLKIKINSCVSDFIGHCDESLMTYYFQLIPGFYGRGWAHDDGNCHCAGVVYLHPSPAENSGTILYAGKKENNIKTNHLLYYREKFYKNENVNKKVYAESRDLHNDQFIENYKVENRYNRLLIYSGKTYHSEGYFFGDSKETSRMTLVFFYLKGKK